MSAVCRVCLRSGFVKNKDIDERLSVFHDELCDYDVFVNSTFTFCPICEYQLKKFYNFKQKCRRAHSIIKTNRAAIKKKEIKNLQELMPPSSIGLLTPQDRQGIFYYWSASILPIAQNLSNNQILVDCNNVDLTPNYAILTSDTDKLVIETVELTPETDKLIVETEESTPETDILTLKTETTTAVENLIKTEFDITVDDEPLVFIQGVKTPDNSDDIIEFKEELDPQSNDEINSEHQNGFETAMIEEFLESDDDEKPLVSCKDKLEYLDSDDEEPLSNKIKHKPKTKKSKPKKSKYLSVNDILDDVSYSDLDGKKDFKINKNSEELFKNVSFLAEELSLQDLKFLSKTMSKSDRMFINLQIRIIELKERVVNLIEQGNLDLGENVTLTKETFLDMFAKCDRSFLKKRGVFKKGQGHVEKIKKFLLYLLKKFNPEYETVFNMEYLTTRSLKLAEFEARKESKEYIMAEFKCELCYKGFELKSLLDYHNKWHDASRPHSCDICTMRFTNRKHLNVHMRTSHYSVYRCKLCDVHTYIFDVMVNHYNQHKGVKYTCEVCLGEYSSKSCLNTHRLTHATHTCTHCARSFVSESGLYNHIKIKHQDNVATPIESPSSPQQATCDKCDAVFKSSDALLKHKKIIHSGNNNLFKCRYRGCLLHFSSAAELRQHSASSGHARRCPPSDGVRKKWAHARVRVRTNVTGPNKPYRTCPICQEQVLNKFRTALYKHHLAAHPTEPYEGADRPECLCEHCGRTFVHRSIYRDHLNTHTGARPYACRECGARFPMRRALYLHQNWHGPPRHQCKDCGKMFRTAANLFSHRRMHIGDRRFKCEICFKGFLHAGSLKEHINGVHNQIRRVKKTK